MLNIIFVLDDWIRTADLWNLCDQSSQKIAQEH